MLNKHILIYRAETVKNALKRLDKIGKKVLLVVDKENKLLGTITDGDIRRHILKGKSLEEDITRVYNKNPSRIKKEDFSARTAKEIFILKKIELLPVVDRNNRVVDCIEWREVLSGKEISVFADNQIDIPVVIMAGGKSTRLEPFTKILPKPLIPIGEKPISEIIIDEFKKCGISRYYMILNYKGEMVESYFNSIKKDYQLKYIKENDFGGTAGGLKLLEKEIDDIFIVSNCDVIVKADFKEVVRFHKSQKAFLTILSSIQHYRIPYGIVKFEEGGRVLDILEKPEYTFTVNAGVYILNKEVLRFIPRNKYFDMTDLISQLIRKGKKTATYPVNENDYIDIGQWEEYKKASEKLL